MGKPCQSCGKPLKRDTDRGTEADGTRSDRFCAHCYADGAFLEPELDAHAMRTRVVGKMQSMGFPRWLARWMSAGVPKLQRWTNG